MTNAATNESRIASLKDKHERLERSIREEEQRPQPDDIRLRQLKQQKLVIKQELEGI